MGIHWPNPNDIIRNIQHGAENAAHQAEHAASQGVRSVGHEIENYLRAVQHDAEAGVRAVQHDVVGKIPEIAKQAVHSALLEGGEQAAKEAFALAAKGARAFYSKLTELRTSKPDLVDAIDGVGFAVTVSVVTFSYSGFYKRAEGLCNVLDAQAKNFKLTRSKVKWLMENTGPTDLTFSIAGELFTTAVSAGIAVTVPYALAVELVDLALEKAGVPE